MFFEIGLVLLMPVISLVARHSCLSLIAVGIPALAGLSVRHGLVPPHPGPLVAISALNADLGITLALGVLVAVPTLVLAGPVFARSAARWVDVPAPELYDVPESSARLRRPSFPLTLGTVLRPVALMIGKALADIFAAKRSTVRTVLDAFGIPGGVAHCGPRDVVHLRAGRRDGPDGGRHVTGAVAAANRRNPAHRGSRR